MSSSRSSFTLIELLIVIGILSILTAAVVIVLNPSELLKQSRDSTRMTDVASIHKTLQLLLTQNPSISLGTASTVYISIPDTSSTCSNLSLPTLPSGYTYHCVSPASSTLTNGQGWLPIDIASTIQSLPKLPLDPSNSSSTGLYYTYTPNTTGQYELTTQFESAKYAPISTQDGGGDPMQYEKGTDLTLTPFAHGLVGYWPFDEGSGTTANDVSGYGSNGTLINSPAWSTGKLGGALSFNNTTTYILVPSFSQLLVRSKTISFWAKPSGVQTYNMIFSNATANYYVSFSGTGDLFSSYKNATGPSQVAATIASGVVDVGAWNHYAFVFSVLDPNITISVYKNGTLVGSKSNSNGCVQPLATNFYIGSFDASSGVFNGLLDDVRVYNRALSVAEVQALYNATK